jgi:hypothetical protein
MRQLTAHCHQCRRVSQEEEEGTVPPSLKRADVSLLPKTSEPHFLLPLRFLLHQLLLNVWPYLGQ